jgi:putative nucleotidyltransferase with HDIG domain
MSSSNDPGKSRSRRAEIRKNRPDTTQLDWQKLKADGVPTSLAIAALFFVLASAILLMRQDVIPWRPDQPIPHDIVSRVAFDYTDKGRLAELRRRAFEREPRVYRADPSAWDNLEKDLVALPDRVAATSGDLPPDLKDVLANDPGAATALRHAASPEGRDAYNRSIETFVGALRQAPAPLIFLRDEERRDDVRERRNIRIGPAPGDLVDPVKTYALGPNQNNAEMLSVVTPPAEVLPTVLQRVVANYVVTHIQPTYALDVDATNIRCNEALNDVPSRDANRHYSADEILVPKKQGAFNQQDWQLLREENRAYLSQLKGSTWEPVAGTACLTLIVTMVLAAYIFQFQPRVVKNHVRALAIAALLLSMLLLAQLAGIGNGPIYLLGIAPTLLVGMILTIAYEQRFAIGIASMHGILVTVALSQGVTFFVILWVGVLTASFLLDDIRTRSKLIEVGGMTALAMMASAAAAGRLAFDSPNFILRNCLYTGAAGLAVGFIVLGILPFVERSFRITTSMTLLELADMSHPLLRRLAVEAPGTYSHSLQVSNLAEAAAEAIGANSLLCRVASYYHDVGKINKPEYFVENQGGGENRHMTLTPSVSTTIIKNHVKDGIALAKEYNLPSSIVPFVEQHHGTTLIEYFYRRALSEDEQKDPDGPAPADHDFRYDGPKPRSRETAILMLADAVESATRTLEEPDYSRVERLVHKLAMGRLQDGQFDECDLTMRNLEQMERSMVKTLLSIYHHRIQYPSTEEATTAPPQPEVKPPQADEPPPSMRLA